MQTLSFVLINLRRCWPREWKHSIHWNRQTSEDVYFLVLTEFKVIKTNLMAREYMINKVYYYCDGIITHYDNVVYYKVQWTVKTNFDSFFISKCDRVYYNLLWQVLQSAIIITNCDSTHWLPYLWICLWFTKYLTAYPTVDAESISAYIFFQIIRKLNSAVLKC